jgi:hypothetical protein
MPAMVLWRLGYAATKSCLHMLTVPFLRCLQELYKGVAESLRPQIIEALQQLVQEMVQL